MKRIAFFIMLSALVFGCKKKATQQSASNNPVPSIPVNLTIYPGDPFYYKVQNPGGWQYIAGGLNGILLYRKSEQEFVAIERTSTYLPNNAAALVKVMTDNFTLRDTISDSHWRMFDGTVTKGPATWALRLYGTNFDGNTLVIRN